MRCAHPVLRRAGRLQRADHAARHLVGDVEEVVLADLVDQVARPPGRRARKCSSTGASSEVSRPCVEPISSRLRTTLSVDGIEGPLAIERLAVCSTSTPWLDRLDVGQPRGAHQVVGVDLDRLRRRRGDDLRQQRAQPLDVEHARRCRRRARRRSPARRRSRPPSPARYVVGVDRARSCRRPCRRPRSRTPWRSRASRAKLSTP